MRLPLCEKHRKHVVQATMQGGLGLRQSVVHVLGDISCSKLERGADDWTTPHGRTPADPLLSLR